MCCWTDRPHQVVPGGTVANAARLSVTRLGGQGHLDTPGPWDGARNRLLATSELALPPEVPPPSLHFTHVHLFTLRAAEIG